MNNFNQESKQHPLAQTETGLSIERSAELVDEQILQQMIIDTSAEIIPMLIEHYVEESTTRLKNIVQAAQNKDQETLEFETHTLGSTSLALGNHALSLAARKIERLCLEKQYSTAFPLVEELKTLADESINALIIRKNEGFSS